MTHRIQSGAAALFALGFLLPCVAQAQPMSQGGYDRSGVYLGLGSAAGFYTEFPFDVDPTVGLNARAGYRVHGHYGFEIEFEWLPEADVNVPVMGDLPTLEGWMLSPNAVGYLLTGRVQPYISYGNGFMQVKTRSQFGPDTVSGFALRFGGGVDVYLTSNIVANVGAAYVFSIGIADVDYVSARGSIAYRF